MPTLTLFRAQPGSENGAAVIVAPRGAYRELAGILEGREVADWFTSRGVTAFVPNYRVGAKARLPIPLLDGERAIRLVRANSAQFKIQPDRIGMIGFSADGEHSSSVRFVDAILWMAGNTAHWRDLPEVPGKWTAVHARFCRWCRNGI